MENGLVFLIGLVIVSISIAVMTHAAVGFLIFGAGLIAVSFLTYLNGGRG